MGNRESPFAKQKFVRELQYAYAYYFIELQDCLLGDSKSIDLIQKAKNLNNYKDSFDSIRKKFFGKLLDKQKRPVISIRVDADGKDLSDFNYNKKTLEFSDGTVLNRKDLEESDKTIFDFLNKNWNQIYKETTEKATLLGHVAGHLAMNGIKGDHLASLSIPDIHKELERRNLPGLDKIEELEEELGFDRDRAYQQIWADAKGAEWLAIYNTQGERKGKAYDLVTKMYREQISHAMAMGADIGDIRSLMHFPDDSEIKKAFGLFEDNISKDEYEKRESLYQQFVVDHLNRDMARFAFTEVSINYNNGKLLRIANESDLSIPQYVKFVKTNPTKSKKKGKTIDSKSCDKCLEYENQIARVFPSYEALQKFEGYHGEDIISSDPLTDIAVWVGKSNAERGSQQSNWWYCTPVHPWCGHSYEYFRVTKQDDDESEYFSKEDNENFENFGDYLKERSIQRSKMFKSENIGNMIVWNEKDCACGGNEYHDQANEDWLKKYIEWKLRSV